MEAIGANMTIYTAVSCRYRMTSPFIFSMILRHARFNEHGFMNRHSMRNISNFIHSNQT
jgi:hypothetical protein